MDNINQKIKCTVDNCHYWDNNLCTAEEIEVAKNIAQGNDMEFGKMGLNTGDSCQTQCKTFKPRQ